MSSKHDPRISPHDIVENAARARRYVADMDREAFEQAELVRDAVERCIERVCGAAYRLGSDEYTLMPGHPWGEMRGMANRLRHAYDRIDVGRVWNTITADSPELESFAATALARLVDEHGPPGAPAPDTKDRTP